eukprot:Colp12_sorted_trinity150504_noHs@8291
MDLNVIHKKKAIEPSELEVFVPQTPKDVGRAIQIMDDKYDTSFNDWIRQEDNAECIGILLRNIVKDYDIEQSANGLKWVVQSWSVQSVAHLIRIITKDWSLTDAANLASL